MKKTLVSALTTALVVGAASTTFAAANPFEDVPADHWAYDAIAQLAADGVVEGYGDGTYRGDQEITRYEMAQMIARAMAKGGGDKALIDKLAAEFADELNNLGVRVANLEKKVDNVKWRGTVRYRYINSQKEKEPHENAQYLTLRLEPEMTINKHWTGHARLDYNSDMNSAANTTAVGGDDTETSGFRMERAWVQGDYDSFQLMLGRLPYVSFIDNGMFFDDNISGGQMTIGNKVKGTVTVGRFNFDPDTTTAWTAAPPDGAGYTFGRTGSYVGVELYNDREDKITWGVGYHRILHRDLYNETYGDGKKAANIWDVGLGWQFTDNFNLNGAYAWNTSVNQGYGEMKNTKHAWTVELDYKGADETDKGSWGAFVAYRKLGSEAVLVPTYDAIAPGQKGVEFGFDYVPMKNFMATFKYFVGKEMNGAHGEPDSTAKTFFTELNFFF